MLARVKLFCVVLAASLGASAFCSFELMYLPDATSRRVWRFDPVNQVVLGSFGAAGNPGPARSVAAGTAPGSLVYVSGTGGADAYNPNTGMRVFENSALSDSVTVTADGQTVMEGYFGLAYRWNASLTFADTSYNPLYTTLTSVTAIDSNRAIVVGVFAGDLVARVRNFTTSTTGPQATLVTSSGLGSAALIGSMTTFVRNGVQRVFQTFVDAGGQNRIISALIPTGSDGFSIQGTTTLANFSNASPLAVIPGHVGYFVVGRDQATPTSTRVTEFRLNGSLVNSYTLSGIAVPTTRWNGAVVLAPEPGTMAALGLGLAAILRRRTRRS